MKLRFYIVCLFCFSSSALFAQQTNTDASIEKLTSALDTLHVPAYRSEKMDSPSQRSLQDRGMCEARTPRTMKLKRE